MKLAGGLTSTSSCIFLTDEADDKSSEDEGSFSAASDVSDEEKDTKIKKQGMFHLTTSDKFNFAPLQIVSFFLYG